MADRAYPSTKPTPTPERSPPPCSTCSEPPPKLPWGSDCRFPFVVVARCSESEPFPVKAEEDEWMSRLPDKKEPLYAHSLPCIEAWLRSLGFSQSREDTAVWFIEKPDWHAQLSLDITDLLIRQIP